MSLEMKYYDAINASTDKLPLFESTLDLFDWIELSVFGVSLNEFPSEI